MTTEASPPSKEPASEPGSIDYAITERGNKTTHTQEEVQPPLIEIEGTYP